MTRQLRFVCLTAAAGLSIALAAAPATGEIRTFHRAGQTFITWSELEPLITAEKVTWGEIKDKLEAAGENGAWTYRIYCHDELITGRNLKQAKLLGEVAPLSGYNANGRNVEYLIGQAMIEPDRVGELARDYNGFVYSWHMDHPRMDRCPIPRFVIDEKAGPLPPGTGLYVHNPAKPGKRYYAVVCRRLAGESGEERLLKGNVLTEPVEETVGPGEPVCQGDGLWGPFFDYPGRRKVYVQWTAPPLSPRPNMYFNWSVLVPPAYLPEAGRPEVQKLAPVELYFHSGNYSYAKPNAKYMAGSVQIAPHDWPFSGWYGYNDALAAYQPNGGRRAGKDAEAGRVSNHTQKRILAFLTWAKKKLPIDPDRIIPVGGDGAAMMALSYPDEFAYVLVTGFEARVLDRKSTRKFARAWGEKDAKITDEKGRGEWAWGELDKAVLADAARNLPLFVCKGGSWGRVTGWGMGRGLFYSAVHQTRQPLYAHWAWGGNLAPPDRYTGLWRGLDIRRDTPVPAFANSSLDKEGEGGGQTNTVYAWKDVKDAPDGFQITITGRESTFDLTPRRLSRFKPKAGEKLGFSAVSLPDRQGKTAPAQSGEVIVDAHGLMTLEKLKLSGGGLVVKIGASSQLPPAEGQGAQEASK